MIDMPALFAPFPTPKLHSLNYTMTIHNRERSFLLRVIISVLISYSIISSSWLYLFAPIELYQQLKFPENRVSNLYREFVNRQQNKQR